MISGMSPKHSYLFSYLKQAFIATKTKSRNDKYTDKYIFGNMDRFSKNAIPSLLAKLTTPVYPDSNR